MISDRTAEGISIAHAASIKTVIAAEAQRTQRIYWNQDKTFTLSATSASLRHILIERNHAKP
jgi:hypothetical protein